MTPRLFFTEDGLTAQVDVLSCAPCDDGFAVVLSRTPFHPQGGGQPSDTGWIGDSEVIKVFHDVEHVVHVVNAAVQTGETQARVDAMRRLLNTRLHSAGHLIGVCGERAGWIPSKAHHWPGECRVSFVPGNAPQPLQAQQVEEQLQRWIDADLPRLTRMEGAQRFIGFGELHAHPCAGTHVSSLKQLKSVPILSIKEKKGVLTVRYDVQ
ncbi:alanyl-tRNA editing protein [Pseudomonas lundensis]|uniref:alanyl-tRNA editing protein n=1 Tax=Pseudomonas lundensis TaxID=86185 RepID=UPI00385DAD73